MASSKPVEMVPVTDGHREEFQRGAGAALARRDASWFAEQGWAATEPAITAVASLAGLWLFGWPAATVFAFSLVCIWNGVWCDCAKLAFVGNAVRREADRDNADRRFWVVAEAIRDGKTEMPARSLAAYKPGTGLFVDFVMGGISSTVLLAVLHAEWRDLLAAFTEPGGTRIALLATLGLQWLVAIATIVHHRRPGVHAPMRFAAGIRGAGLFVVMMIMLVTLENGGGARKLVIAMNVGLLAFAVLSAWGMKLLRDETNWLRRHVGDMRSRSEAASGARTGQAS